MDRLAAADEPGIVAAKSVEEISDQIGEQLRRAREVAGLTVDDVVFRTRIPRSVVNALEAGDFSVFASATYARSFLSQYGGFLNVNVDLWVDAIEPISYASGDVELGAWEPGRSRHQPAATERESSSGWIAAAGTLALSCGLIFGAIKGFEILETRFGGEENTPKVEPVETREAVNPPPPDTRVPGLPGMVNEPEESRMAALQEDGFVEPPPRAKVVRD